MEKNMYPKMTDVPETVDAPPSYNQTCYPSAPAPPSVYVPQVGVPQGPTPYQQQQIQQQQPQPGMTIYVTNTQIPLLGPNPCLVTCPSCHTQAQSKVIFESSSKTHILALLLCVFGLCCCSCIPYLVDSCKDANHYCAYCNTYFGRYTK